MDDFKLGRSQEVLDYLKVKGQIDSYTFFEHAKITPHKGQRQILDAYLSKKAPGPEALALGLTFEYQYKTLIAACGRRFGKSFITSGLAAEEMLYPNAHVLVCSYRLSNCKVIFKQTRKLIKALGIEITADRQKEQELELINGASLKVASNDNVEASLGNSVSLLIIDEAKLFNRDLYEIYLEPQLLDYAPYSRTIMISSPEEGWLLDYYERGQADDPRYAEYWSVSLPSSANPTNSAEALAKLKSRLPPDIWEQEYEGKFISAAGKVVKEFDREACVFSEEDFPEFWGRVRSGYHEVFHSIDSGYSHYFGGVYFMYVEELDTYFAFGEYNKNRTITKVHAENIKEFEDQVGFEPQMRYADPAASQQIADLHEEGLAYNKSEKNLRESVNCVNTLFYQKSAITGRPRLLIHHECIELIRQVATVFWKEDADDQTREKSAAGVKPFRPDKDMKTDWDIFDAFRYGIYTYDRNGRVGVAILTDTPPGDDEQDDEEAKFRAAMAAAGYISMGEAG